MSESKLLVVGAGGHGAVVAETARAAGFQVVGFADGRESLRGTLRCGLPVLATGEDEGIALARRERLAVAVAVGEPRARWRIFQHYAEAGLSHPPIVHPSAIVAPSCTIGDGTVIFAGVVVQPHTRVGRCCILNTGCTVDHDSDLADLVHLSPGVHMGGSVTVERGTHLGVGVSVRNGVRIGPWAVVGVGAAVVGDLAGNCTYVGVPARPHLNEKNC